MKSKTKYVQKALALILSTVMVLSLAGPALAADEPIPVTETFTSSGSWTCPTGVSEVTVELWGGGGGGAGANSGNSRGSGGGGGAYARKTFAVTPGASYSYIVGAGGSAGSSSGGVGGNGGYSQWVDSSTLRANGGTGGSTSSTGGGAGGTVSPVADVSYPGGSGANRGSNYSGGGGGGAGSTGAGGNASGATAGAARSENGGAGGTGRTSNNNGGAGSNYGGGGGGAYRSSNSYTGGAGAMGAVRVSYAYTPHSPTEWARPYSNASASNVNNPGNAYLSDNQDAEFTSNTSSVYYRDFRMFDTQISLVPEDAVIVGIEVRLEARKYNTTENRQFSVTLCNGTTARGAAKYTGNLTASDAIYTLGGPADKWGYSDWTAANINAADFGIRVAAYQGGSTSYRYLDQIQIRVYYANANSTPVANAQSVSTAEGVAKDITLTGTDADGDPLTYSIVDGPDHGALGAVSGANVTYTPTAGFAGADSFTFKVNDGTDDSAPATVDITVTPNTYVLTMGVSPADSGTATDVTDAGPYVAGTPVSISATPESGYHFVNWTSSNGGSFTDASSSGTTFTMPASATTVTANFVINSYTVTFVDYNDAVLKTEDVAHGGAATAPTDPDNMAGHHFTGWDRAFDNVTEPLTVKALYDINSYTVTFVDYNDAVLKTENVAHGGAATAPANPDNMAGHHFTAWDKAFDNVTEPLTVKALYDINIYTVTFVDYNDAVLKTEDVAHGGAATAPTDPDNMDGHHFTAWDKAFDNVTEPLTVKALYDINIYTVKWIVEGAETDEDYDYNAMPSYKGGTPTKAGNAQYSYTFSGWDPDVVAVTEDATYTAQFDSETVEYAIGWDTDGDGDVDDTTMVAYGTVPTHVDGAKASTVQYDYTFDGWDPTVMEVDGATTYTATFNSTLRSYTIGWDTDGDGDVDDSAAVAFGTVPTHADGAKASTAQYDYTFSGWDPTVVAVAGEATYTATFNSTLRSYTIGWDTDGDGNVDDSATVNYGVMPAHADGVKVADAEFTYTFSGWNPAVVEVDGPATYTAQFTGATNSYTVKWVVEGAETQEVYLYNATPSYKGEPPVKPATAEFTYTFSGWDPELAAVTGPATYTAQFDSEPVEYAIGWDTDGDGDVDDTTMVAYGTVPTHGDGAKAADEAFTYTFKAWSPAPVSVTGAVTYTATFDSEAVEYAIGWDTDGDGDVDDTTMVAYGTVPTHADGAKAADDEFTYAFTGWSPALVAVTGETAYAATFNSTLRSYDIGWDTDGDGDVDDTTMVAYGTVPTHADGAKAADDEFTYAFTGWSPAVVAVTGETAYAATFNSTLRSYTIGWDTDGDGNVDDSATVNYGVMPAHADGVKVADAEFTYTFSGWEPALEAVTNDATYTAQFTGATNSYTVKWVVEGAETQEVYLYNATPSYKGEPPVKPATAEFTYTFSGWAPELAAVTGPATYTAQFSSSTNAYTVTWVDGNGEEIYTEQVPYGETPEYDFGHGTPGKDSTAQYHYTFSGWLPPVGEIGGEVTYVAQFTPVLRSYTISWDTDGDSDVDDTTTVFFGELPAHDDGVKPADDENFYDFAGWFPSIVTVTDEATYTATFTTVPRTWTVKVDPVDFGTINKGELSATPPKYIVITNEGNSPAAILSVTVDAGDAEVAFEIGGPADGAIVPAEGTLNDTYSIQPKDDLTPGTYTQTITVTFEGGEVLTAMASVTIGINDPVPVAVDDLYTAQMNGLLEGNVLTNDTDVNGDTLTAILVGEPAHGALVLNADGTFTYEPALNFVGEDSFTYKANDGRSDSNEATVSITVSAEPYTTLVGPDPAVIRIGNTFEVKYYLHNVLNVSAQDVTLSYDPAVFEFMGLAAEGPADQVFAVFDDDEETGKVKVILANVVPMIGDGNLIFTATFKAVGVMASSEIALTKAEVASADAPSVILNPALSSLTVGTADPSELAALIDSAQDTHDDASEGTASGEYPKGAKKALQSAINAAQGVLDNMASTQAQLDAAKDALRNALSAFRALEREIMAGDFNNNGRLDIGDLSVFITHYGEVGDDAYDYDMNNDGVVDTEDLTILMLLILG